MAGSGMPLNVSREAGLRQVAMLVRLMYHNGMQKEYLNNMKHVLWMFHVYLVRQIQFLL